jgi:hypothetical protein
MKTISRAIFLTITLTICASNALAQSGPYSYYAVTPCRVVDTRNAVSTNGGPALAMAPRSFSIRGQCGVPTSAKAVSINVTVTNASSNSWLTIWPSGQAEPFVSTINYDSTVSALANGALVGLSTSATDLTVHNAAGSVHVIIDVTGYYQ